MNNGSTSSALLWLVFALQAVCQRAQTHFCFLTIQMAEVSGVDAIYLYSHSYEHIGGVYRETGIYARESHFDLQGPVVHCVNVQDFEITWRVRKPAGVDVKPRNFRLLLWPLPFEMKLLRDSPAG
nr:unnamed protein product [Spirometra erinaceieuropaei]